MISRLLASILLLSSVALTGTIALRPGPSLDGALCQDGPVPVVWPLGSTGFEPGRLLCSHGQFQHYDTEEPEVHEGIDIAACIGDEVYAVEDGTVDYVSDDGGMGNGYVHVRDADEPTLGWKYMHLKDIAVKVDEGFNQVLRDQFIGRVADFPGVVDGFNHLHLERMAVKGLATTLDPTAQNGGDPLNWLAARTDASPPRRLPFGPPHPDLAGFLFFSVAGGTALAPDDLAGETVDIVGRVSDTFPGVAAPTCTPIVGACAGPTAPMEITPKRISLGIFHEREDPSGTALPRTRLERVFHNVIDLSIPIRDIDDPVGASATWEDRKAFAAHVYREGSVGNYTERHFLVNLTRCQIDGSGSFAFDDSGEYLLQLVLEDWSGNVDHFERTIAIP